MPDPTDPPAHELPPVTVTGHRRNDPGMSFPSQPPPPYVPDVAVIDPFPPEPGPCDDPSTREEFDSDAAAAKALKKILSEIERKGEAFATREYGALLYRGDDGVIDYIRLDAGPGGGYGPPVDIAGLDPTRIVGYVHTHPGGSPAPTAADWMDVYTYLYNAGTALGGDMSNLRLYIAIQIGSYLETETKLYVFKGGDWSTPEADMEVNQEAQPCGY